MIFAMVLLKTRCYPDYHKTFSNYWRKTMKKCILLLTVLLFPALVFAGGGKDAASRGNYMRLTWWGNTVRD
jgi:hypothetical protein